MSILIHHFEGKNVNESLTDKDKGKLFYTKTWNIEYPFVDQNGRNLKLIASVNTNALNLNDFPNTLHGNFYFNNVLISGKNSAYGKFNLGFGFNDQNKLIGNIYFDKDMKKLFQKYGDMQKALEEFNNISNENIKDFDFLEGNFDDCNITSDEIPKIYKVRF